MSRMFKVSSMAAFAAAVVLVLGSARFAPAADEKKEDKKAEAAKTGTISGTVTAADGKPAKEVTVRLFASRPRGERGNQTTGVQRSDGEVLVAAADKPAAEKPAADKPAAENAGDRPRGERQGRGQRQQALKEAKTNDKGEFTFADVPVGEYSVAATEGNNSARGRATVKAGETAKVELALKAREPGQGRGNRGNNNQNRNQNQNQAEGAAK